MKVETLSNSKHTNTVYAQKVGLIVNNRNLAEFYFTGICENRKGKWMMIVEGHPSNTKMYFEGGICT